MVWWLRLSSTRRVRICKFGGLTRAGSLSERVKSPCRTGVSSNVSAWGFLMRDFLLPCRCRVCSPQVWLERRRARSGPGPPKESCGKEVETMDKGDKTAAWTQSSLWDPVHLWFPKHGFCLWNRRRNAPNASECKDRLSIHSHCHITGIHSSHGSIIGTGCDKLRPRRSQSGGALSLLALRDNII